MGVLHSTDVKGERFITMRYKFIAIDWLYWMTLIPSILIDKLPLSEVQKTAEWQDTWEAEWFGEFYAWYQYLTNIPSVQIAESVSPEFLHAHYNVLHDLDIRLAVKKLAKFRGVNI